MLLKIKLLLIFVAICCVCQSALLSAQKGGGSFSKFKKTIESFRQSQQVPVPAPIQVTSSSSSSSFASNQQQNIPIANSELIISNNNEQQLQEGLQLQQQNEFSSQVSISQDQSDTSDHLYGAVAGVAGQDFPAYTRIPLTKFSCNQVPISPGLYADLETGCQAFHVCFDGRRESFLCGIGTVFNQQTLNCDYWYAVDCSKSVQFYSSNVEFGKSGNWQSLVQKNQFVSTNQQQSEIVAATKGGSSSSQHATSFLQSIRPTSSSNSQQTVINRVTQQQQVAPVITSNFVNRNSIVDQSSFLNGKTSLPKHQKAQSFFNSFRSNQLVAPASKTRVASSSSSFADSSDNNLLESSVMRVRMKMNDNSTAEQNQEEPKIPATNYSNQINNQESSQDSQWRPIFKTNSKVGTTDDSAERSVPLKATASSPAINGETVLPGERFKEALENPKFGNATQANADATSTPPQNESSPPASVQPQTTTDTPIPNSTENLGTERVLQGSSGTTSAENSGTEPPKAATESTEQASFSVTMKSESAFDSNRTDTATVTTTVSPQLASSASTTDIENESATTTTI